MRVIHVHARVGYIEPVWVQFEDGHRVTVSPNTGGWGMPQGIDRVWWSLNERMVGTFHSPYQHPLNYRPFGFVDLAPGYTVRQLGRYWGLADDFLKTPSSQRNPRNEAAWRVFSLGHRELQEVRPASGPSPTRRLDKSNS